jgi:hypothetical protein
MAFPLTIQATLRVPLPGGAAVTDRLLLAAVRRALADHHAAADPPGYDGGALAFRRPIHHRSKNRTPLADVHRGRVATRVEGGAAVFEYELSLARVAALLAAGGLAVYPFFLAPLLGRPVLSPGPVLAGMAIAAVSHALGYARAARRFPRLLAEATEDAVRRAAARALAAPPAS